MRDNRFVRGMALLAALGVLAAGAAARADEKGGDKGTVYKTPQEAFKAFAATLKQRDYKKAVQCLTPESRDIAAAQAWLFGQVAVVTNGEIQWGKGSDPKASEKVQTLKKALDNHGVGDEAIKKRILTGGAINFDAGKFQNLEEAKKAHKLIAGLVKDRDGFIGDVLGVLDTMGRSTLEGEPKLQDLKVEGNSARGVLVYQINGKEKREPIGFTKVGQGWKIEGLLPLD